MAVLKWSLVKADWRRFALYCLQQRQEALRYMHTYEDSHSSKVPPYPDFLFPGCRNIEAESVARQGTRFVASTDRCAPAVRMSCGMNDQYTRY